jgi:hypothetical protein
MIGIGRGRWWRAAVVVAMAASAMAGPAWGWGRLGHRLAGRIAEDRLTPAARAAVRDLLGPGESLADVSNWADEYRRDHPETGPWHYVNVPIAEPRFDARFIPKEGCVVTKVDEFRKALADPATPRQDRVKALKFLAHFLQDMHQPVHVGHRDDRGGNSLQVQFFGRGSNLHRVWDSGLLERTGRDEPDYVSLLEKGITPEQARAWSGGQSVDWANESLDLARKAYRNPPDNAEIRNGDRLGQPYQDANLPLAERRVAQAGVRLAWILNEIFQ